MSRRRSREAAVGAHRPRSRARRRRADRFPLHQDCDRRSEHRTDRPHSQRDRRRQDRPAVDARGARTIQAGTGTVALALRGIVKRFGDVVAVDGADLALEAGTIHALVGENGAGKSTLANVAFGALAPDAGTVESRGPVGLVHQHFELVDRLTVWENVLLGREPRRGWRIDVAAARAQVNELAARHGLAVDPDALVETLPIGIKQRVELLRELEREPAILLLDEPTAVLAPSEIASFFATIVALARRGTAIMVVTHKLAEVIAYASTVSVMRAGKIVAQMQTAQTSVQALAQAMVGGELPPLAQRAATPNAAEPALRARRLSARSEADAIEEFDLEIAPGEIVGIAGVEGNGQTALADALAGTIPHDGTLELRGSRGTIPQDRQREGLVLDWTIAENVLLGRQRSPAFHKGPQIDRGASVAFAQEIIEQFDVRPPRPQAPMRGLSGGNQQKVVVGRALAGEPAFVLAYQPTRGIDVGAAALVQSRLIEARNAGSAILLVSFELDELFALADRIVVLFRGRIAGTFAREGFDRGRIGALMAGGS
ncbi:MAG: ABC transporter ATP-binding protein [Candidatus Eremiobacteraeota bacterium]|nr:ABC transporter ATP-binding protein [Candidatus Eremiobacteraeota bacterium]